MKVRQICIWTILFAMCFQLKTIKPYQAYMYTRKINLDFLQKFQLSRGESLDGKREINVCEAKINLYFLIGFAHRFPLE